MSLFVYIGVENGVHFLMNISPDNVLVPVIALTDILMIKGIRTRSDSMVVLSTPVNGVVDIIYTENQQISHIPYTQEGIIDMAILLFNRGLEESYVISRQDDTLSLHKWSTIPPTNVPRPVIGNFDVIRCEYIEDRSN